MQCTNYVVVFVRCTLDGLIVFLLEYKELSLWSVLRFLALCKTQICSRERMDSNSLSYEVASASDCRHGFPFRIRFLKNDH